MPIYSPSSPAWAAAQRLTAEGGFEAVQETVGARLSAIRAASKTFCLDSFILKQALKQRRSICSRAFQSAMISSLRFLVIFAG